MLQRFSYVLVVDLELVHLVCCPKGQIPVEDNNKTIEVMSTNLVLVVLLLTLAIPALFFQKSICIKIKINLIYFFLYFFVKRQKDL